jgi:hypothetical protein
MSPNAAAARSLVAGFFLVKDFPLVDKLVLMPIFMHTPPQHQLHKPPVCPIPGAICIYIVRLCNFGSLQKRKPQSNLNFDPVI